MIRSVRLALFALLATAPLHAAPQAAPARTFTAADLFGLEVASDPQISPDGRRIAYVRRSNDIMTDRARPTIWLIDVASGAQTPLEAGPGAHSSPRWSPDGTRLAFLSSDGGGATQLRVRWLAGGEAARVASLPKTPSSLAWSPDGKAIAFLMAVPGEATTIASPAAKPEDAKWAPPLQVISRLVYRADGEGYLAPGFDHVFVVPADGGAARQVSFGAYADNGPLAWSKDGRAILFSSNRSADPQRNGNESDIFAADVGSGSLTQLTHRAGPDGQPTVSPDGTKIAFIGFDDKFLGYQNARLSVMDRDGGNPRVLTTGLDRSVGSPKWAADGKGVYVSYDDRGATRVARIGLDGSVRDIAGGLAQSALDRPYTGGSYSVAKDGTIAFTGGSALRPADVMVVRGATTRRLTRLNEELLAAKSLAQVRKLPVLSSFDQRPIDAWIVTPPDYDPARKYPMILEIHGGPFSAYGPSFSTDDQLYAAAGYVVVYANPRGSTSYGEEFADLIHHAYPGHDYDDLMSAVDAAIADGHVDADRLYVTGGSGGGVLTAWIVGKTDRFKAAVTQKPVIDWASFVLTADSTNFFARYWFGKFPWEDPQGYWARSPLSLVGNVKTPTMVVVGSEDYRTPVSEAEQYYTALQLRGVPTQLVKVPGAGHESIAVRPSQSAAKAQAILGWFARFGGAPAQP